MSKHKNFLGKAFDAIIAGRERAAQRYVEHFERINGTGERKFTKR